MTRFKPYDDESDAIAAQYGREVLFEVILMGNTAKVTAIDADTGLEVSIIAPANATSYTLKMNAMRKLEAALAKAEAEAAEPGGRHPRRPGRYA
ncbi:MAG: hypothetical protein JNK21_04145 [Rhodospirillaceae bacterium]|nr:hypothetical protein [Rhodospirillaceae bacterium]